MFNFEVNRIENHQLTLEDTKKNVERKNRYFINSN